MSALRESGLLPQAVLNIAGQTEPGQTAISIGDLLNATGTTVPGGSVRQRSSEVWGFDFDHPPPGVSSTRRIEEYLHLDLQDFVEARNYLAEEIRSYSRSRTAHFDPVVPGGAKPSGACSGSAPDGGTAATFCPHYVATAQAPVPRADAYYSALVRYNVVRPTPDLFNATNYAETVDAALTFAAQLFKSEGNIPIALRSQIMGPITPLLTGKERPGRLSFCATPFSDGTGTAVFAQVFGFGAPLDIGAQMLLVLGEDGLECALTGNIEGANCEDPQHPGIIDPPTKGVRWWMASSPFMRPPSRG